MDVIKEEPDLDEGTSQLSTLKDEPLIDIKYEDNYDRVSPALFVSPEMKFLDAVKLEPDSDSEPDPLPDMKHDELVIPTTSPVVLKNEEVEEMLDFAADGVVISEEHDSFVPRGQSVTLHGRNMRQPQPVDLNLIKADSIPLNCTMDDKTMILLSQHIFTAQQYGGSNTDHALQQTAQGDSENEVSGIRRKRSSCSGNRKTHVHVDPSKKSLTSSERRGQTTQKTYTCKICSKVFSYNCNLKRHIRIHNGVKSFKCDICGKVFLERGGMKHHLRTHTGERPSKCDICGKAFSNNGNLKSHIRIHTGEKPFKCDTCGRAFSNNGSLKHHTFTHTGEKPFKCDVCGKLFSLSWNLKYHIRTHMSEKPLR